LDPVLIVEDNNANFVNLDLLTKGVVMFFELFSFTLIGLLIILDDRQGPKAKETSQTTDNFIAYNPDVS